MQQLHAVIMMVIKHRQVLIWQMVMVFTTWREMFGNGITIGMAAVGIRRQGRQMLTLGDQHPAPSACGAAAGGAALPSTRGAPIAPTTRRFSAATALASGVCGFEGSGRRDGELEGRCPQRPNASVSIESNRRAEQAPVALDASKPHFPV